MTVGSVQLPSCCSFVFRRGYASNFQALWNCVPSVNCSFMPTQTLQSASGWLRGLADSPIAAALQAIHADPAALWTVERLAAEVHLSRSAFAERFKAIVGEPPMQYVQRWRMQRAAHFMDAGNLPLKTIIAMSGYASEAAFRKAFHQWNGMLPSQYKEGIQRPGEKKTKVDIYSLPGHTSSR